METCGTVDVQAMHKANRVRVIAAYLIDQLCEDCPEFKAWWLRKTNISLPQHAFQDSQRIRLRNALARNRL